MLKRTDAGSSFFCMPGMFAVPVGYEKPTPPDYREGNLKARASLVTAGSERSCMGNLEHSVSEPVLAFRAGNPAKYGKAQKMDSPLGFDGWLQVQAGRLIRGSPVLSCADVRSDWLARFTPFGQVIPINRKRE